MKKIIFLLFGLITIIGCHNPQTEYSRQFSFNEYVDTFNLYSLEAKVFQTIGKYEGLCSEKVSVGPYGYMGKTVYYLSSELLYDDKYINEKACFLGIYHYLAADSTYKTVPIYAALET